MSILKSDIVIARSAKIKPIGDVLGKFNVPDDPFSFSPMGRHVAKLNFEYIDKLKEKKSNLILVTAITPTPAGEGKTTTSVGLNDGLNKIGKKSIVCLREPSLGPSFGMKGGAAGGGNAQVVPMEQINLHFTGDFHAITSAHNLLSALIDNHIYWGNKLNIDEKKIVWKRVVDMNDRALRFIDINTKGVAKDFAREDGFDITVASEVMAIFCLSNDLSDLEKRIGNITIAYDKNNKPVYAKDLNAQGPMTVLLKEAIRPNVTQSLEHNPAIIHGGPFANIAHGCNSVIATKSALKLSKYVVTEAGFGADLGAEKFLDIKCRKANIKPSCVVIVATVRALKMHGGVEKENLKTENVEALKKGLVNLERHINNLRKFGVESIVAINHFVMDTENEIKVLEEYCNKLPSVPDELYETETTIVVADSKLGWARAFKELVSLLYGGHIPKWDTTKVRAAGEPLKTFGGRASGPEPLIDLFKFTVSTIKNALGRKLKPVECHDIVCKIAEIVVVGGVRRSALISLSNLNDREMRFAKHGEWYKDNVQRALANNSVNYK